METRDYVVIDVETTGTDPKKHQILSVAMLALDSTLKPLGFGSWKIKHDNYVVDPKALEINRINLVKHHNNPKSLNVSTAKSHMIAFFNTPVHRPAGQQQKMIAIGHNLGFDVGFITEFLPTWWNFVHYRKLDTQVIAMERILTGRLPADCGSGLGDLTAHFNLEYKAHTAPGDVYATYKVLKKLLAS